jgi:4-hydroxyphenylacetate 3-monooxygenase
MSAASCAAARSASRPISRRSRTPETAPWLEKYYTINEDWRSEDRRRLLAFARDSPNSDYAGHRLTFQLFALFVCAF